MKNCVFSAPDAENGIREKVWMTAGEAADYLSVKRDTLLLWARQRKIPAYRLSGIAKHTWRFKRTDLDAMLCASSAVAADGRQQ